MHFRRDEKGQPNLNQRMARGRSHTLDGIERGTPEPFIFQEGQPFWEQELAGLLKLDSWKLPEGMTSESFLLLA